MPEFSPFYAPFCPWFWNAKGEKREARKRREKSQQVRSFLLLACRNLKLTEGFLDQNMDTLDLSLLQIEQREEEQLQRQRLIGGNI
jgi:hypothetical protein